MESSGIVNLKVIDNLKHDAEAFLTTTYLEYQGVAIWPKEIEVYYYKKDVFEDGSVHGNNLQRNNKNHFYVHRWGMGEKDKYKGGNRAGLDFVVSDSVNVYYSYLIRSAVIGEKLIIGPNKVLKYLTDACGLLYEELESIRVNLVGSNSDGNVVFSNRINLGENAGEYKDCELRAVLCDRWFRDGKYPLKEKMIVDFLLKQLELMRMAPNQAIVYAKNNLGYIPSVLKNL